MSRLLSGLFCLLLSPLLLSAHRVISLAPHTTELAYAAGLGDQLIAVSSYSDYPTEANKLEQVASWQGINIERIMELKPDLVLAWRGGNPQRSLDQLTKFGIKILYLDAENIGDVADNLEQLARYSSHPEQGRKAGVHLRQQIEKLRQQSHTLPRYRVLLQFGTKPLLTTNSRSLQSGILNLCGAQNIFADSPVPWPQVSREQVLLRKPQVIVIPGGPDDALLIKAFWEKQLDIPVLTLHEDWLSRSGPRILLAAQSLCQQLAKLTASTRNKEYSQ